MDPVAFPSVLGFPLLDSYHTYAILDTLVSGKLHMVQENLPEALKSCLEIGMRVLRAYNRLLLVSLGEKD